MGSPTETEGNLNTTHAQTNSYTHTNPYTYRHTQTQKLIHSHTRTHTNGVMSSERYEELEDDFDNHIKQLEQIVMTKLPKLSGELRKRELRVADKLIEDADGEITQMFDEAQSAPGAYRSSLMSRSRGYKAQLELLKKEYQKAVQASNNRTELLGNTTDWNQGGGREDAARSRMAEGLASLERGAQSVQRSERVAAETDEVGIQIIGDLDDQRDTLLRTRDKLHETDADLSRSRRILNTMAMKVATNKVLLVVVIFLELAVIAGIVYLKFIK